tara:strand:- start:359 stop:787 length:429 start_codon:yes stop_codon:yes gene_type:complete
MKKSIVIASDHAGYKLKSSLIKHIRNKSFIDLGTNSEKKVDYPDYAKKLVKQIKDKRHVKGILICGSGIGMSIAANRFKGIRASLCFTPEMAKLSRKHNDANILVLPGRFIDVKTAKLCIDKFINTNFDGNRHLKRIKKIDR